MIIDQLSAADASKTLSEHRPSRYSQPVAGRGYYQVMGEARNRLEEGEDLQDVLVLLRSRGSGPMQCIADVKDLLGVDLAEAKLIVLNGLAFADVRAGDDAFWDAVAEAEKEV